MVQPPLAGPVALQPAPRGGQLPHGRAPGGYGMQPTPAPQIPNVAQPPAPVRSSADSAAALHPSPDPSRAASGTPEPTPRAPPPAYAPAAGPQGHRAAPQQHAASASPQPRYPPEQWPRREASAEPPHQWHQAPPAPRAPAADLQHQQAEALHSLDLADSALEQVTFSHMPGGRADLVGDANVAGNALTDFGALLGASRMHSLRAARNRIPHVPRLSGLAALTRCDLSHNAIESLDGGAFGGMRALEVLSLEGNRLGEVPVDAFGGCSHLRVLNLRRNRLARLPAAAGCAALEQLLLDGNRIAGLCADVMGLADASQSLRSLGLRDNAIADWGELRGVGAFERLQALAVSGNPAFAPAALPFDHRVLAAWLCPLLREFDGTPISPEEQAAAGRLFADPSGQLGNAVTLLDCPSGDGRLLEHLAAAAPCPGRTPQAPPGGAAWSGAAEREAFAALQQKVKEISRVVRVLHRQDVGRRLRAAATIQRYWRGYCGRALLPPGRSAAMRRLSVWRGPRRGRPRSPAARQRASSAAVDAVVAESRAVARRMRCPALADDPALLHPSAPKPLRGAALSGPAAAAVQLQRAARGALVRWRWESLRLRSFAALTAQAAWRGYVVRRDRCERPREFLLRRDLRAAERQREQLARQVARLQDALRVLWNDSREWRAALRSQQQTSARRIQRHWRAWAAARTAARLRRQRREDWERCAAPAAAIQALWRGHSQRRKYETLRDRCYAALSIQAVWRGVRARRRCAELAEKRRMRDDICTLKQQVAQLFSMLGAQQQRASTPPPQPAARHAGGQPPAPSAAPPRRTPPQQPRRESTPPRQPRSESTPSEGGARAPRPSVSPEWQDAAEDTPGAVPSPGSREEEEEEDYEECEEQYEDYRADEAPQCDGEYTEEGVEEEEGHPDEDADETDDLYAPDLDPEQQPTAKAPRRFVMAQQQQQHQQQPPRRDILAAAGPGGGFRGSFIDSAAVAASAPRVHGTVARGPVLRTQSRADEKTARLFSEVASKWDSPSRQLPARARHADAVVLDSPSSAALGSGVDSSLGSVPPQQPHSDDPLRRLVSPAVGPAAVPAPGGVRLGRSPPGRSPPRAPPPNYSARAAGYGPGL
eukprot:TRINITY_DN6893_c2_g1_i1.p1 TRINITY_DN6893_c2_g1~~TRINITY_DN6893_c2_g1_i1.p1  ORF type:complete len:1112 (+),score=309.35 TRINITY_DN6893_c2_g1_i1:74-3409(+)